MKLSHHKLIIIGLQDMSNISTTEIGGKHTADTTTAKTQ